MKNCAIVVLFCLLSVALAEEFPYLPGVEITPGTGQRERYQIAPLVINEPVWKTLERMTVGERKNSEIDLVLEREAPEQALQAAGRIENLWNRGRFEEALALFAELEKLTDKNEMAIGNSWRTPVPTRGGACWGTDVRIGNRDSVFVSALDVHRSTGNLFAVLLLQGDGNTNRWDVYFSTDGGANWSETYDWWAGYEMNSLSASVVGYYCHVGFSRGGAQDQALLYRFSTTDGQREDFDDGSSYITVFTTTSPDSLKEVVLTSNQDYYDNRLYYLALTTQGNLRFFWDDPACTSWLEIATNVSNAHMGLDAACNEAFWDYFLWSSYITTGDDLQIDAAHAWSEEWDSMTTYAIGPMNYNTAIGAYDDTVTCFFEYNGAVFHCRYLVSYDGGVNWYWGFVDDTTTLAESPDLTARKGAGVGMIYRFYTSPREGRYTWRNYAGSWKTPVSYADHQPYWNRPSIEYLGDDIYGVVYLSWTSPHTRAAYFDCHVQSGVDDSQVSFPASFELLQNYPNPFNARTTIGYILPRAARVTINIYDLVGRKIETVIDQGETAGYHQVAWEAEDIPSGVYFYRIRAGADTETRRMILLR